MAWSGQLTLPGVSGTMSDHRNENWYFEAVSGAEIKNLGVDESYLDKALVIINKKTDKQLKSGEITQIDAQSDSIGLPAVSLPVWNEEKQQFEEKQWEQEKQHKTVSYIEVIRKDHTKQYLTYTPQYIEEYYDTLRHPEINSDVKAEAILEKNGIESVEIKKLKPDAKEEAERCEMPYQLDVFNKIEYGTVDYVTLTLSGNDIGFTEVVTQATRLGDIQFAIKGNKEPRSRDINNLFNVNNMTDMLNGKLLLFDTKVKYYLYSAYAAIQGKAGEQAKIIVAGYPNLFDYGFSWLLSSDNRENINGYIPKFNERIKQIVDDCRIYGGMNIYFVSAEEVFDGHGAYSDDAYINPIMETQNEDLDWTAFPPVSDYSIHPNEKGAKAYASAVQNKINELEENGIISGFIYEDSEQNWNISTYSKIEKISAVNVDTGNTKILYKQLFESSDSISILKSGYYEMVLPPGRYNLEVTFTDGTSSFVNKNGVLESETKKKDNYKVIDVKKRDILKNNDIYLERDPVEFEWYLEPSVEAEDINEVQQIRYGVNYGYFIESDYSLIKQNEKYGIIDIDGNIIVNPSYANAGGELRSHIVLQNDEDGIVFCTKHKVITNKAGNYCDKCNVLSTTYYASDYIYDTKLNILSSVDGGKHSYTEHYINGGQNGRGIMTLNDAVTARAAVFPDNYTKQDATAQCINSYGVVKNNKVLLDFEYNNAVSYKNNIAALSKNGKWGYVDSEGEIILDFIYDGDFNTFEDNVAYLPSDGYIAVNTKNKGGYYDTEGNEIIPVGTFEDVRPVYNGKAWVKDKKTGLWGVISLPRTWQEIYKAKLSEYYNSDEYTNDQNPQSGSMFDLCDIDDDGIPELFISEGIYTSANVRVYTVANNEIQELLHGGSYGELHVNKKCSYIMTDWVRVGYEQHEIYHLNDTDCNMIINLAGSYAYEDGTYENAEGYSINDISVTKEEYLKQYKNYLDDIDWEFCGRKFNFNQIDGDLNDLWSPTVKCQ